MPRCNAKKVGIMGAVKNAVGLGDNPDQVAPTNPSEAQVQEEVPEVVPEPEPEPEQTTVHTPQTVAPTMDDKVRYENRSHRMKKILQEQPKVQFMIPLGIGEKKGAYDTVQINGYKLTIMKGAMVSLPQQVVDLLAAKYEVDMTAGAEHRVDGDDAKSSALS